MHQSSTQPMTTGDNISEKLEYYHKLRPLIARCLTLNHDLNNPLAGIIGYAEFLQMDAEALTKEQQKGLQQILKCAERIRASIDALCKEKAELSKSVDLTTILEVLDK